MRLPKIVAKPDHEKVIITVSESLAAYSYDYKAALMSNTQTPQTLPSPQPDK